MSIGKQTQEKKSHTESNGELGSISTEILQREVRRREASEALGKFKKQIAEVSDLDTARKLSANFAQKVRKLTTTEKD